MTTAVAAATTMMGRGGSDVDGDGDGDDGDGDGDGDDGDDGDGDDHLPVEWKVARWAESGSWGADSLAHSLSLWGNSL